MTSKLLGLVAGLLLLAVVYWVTREIRNAKGGHHAPEPSAGGSDPAPPDRRDRPRPQ